MYSFKMVLSRPKEAIRSLAGLDRPPDTPPLYAPTIPQRNTKKRHRQETPKKLPPFWTPNRDQYPSPLSFKPPISLPWGKTQPATHPEPIAAPCLKRASPLEALHQNARSTANSHKQSVLPQILNLKPWRQSATTC